MWTVGSIYYIPESPLQPLVLMEEFLMYLPREEGQGLVEYALILVLVAVVVIAILTVLGPQIGNVFSAITGDMATP